ncbi:hypothetical protein HPB48_001748 [Haemaphysalis longicornis]|uniref:Uncharacterized protein n=1 Tax=Haemaphysalis longicornis TaxID=44386 RepID=A0A9J6GDI1_HAELO|nr:hypothetical protein HPB48_001748 [Haemaphysalis longicornis]
MKVSVGTLIGKENVTKLDAIPCSNDTVYRRMREITSDVQDRVVEKFESPGEFPLRVDESLDVYGSPQLIVFVRFVDGSNIAERPPLLSWMSRLQTRRVFTFDATFFVSHGLRWYMCGRVCTKQHLIHGWKPLLVIGDSLRMLTVQ